MISKMTSKPELHHSCSYHGSIQRYISYWDKYNIPLKLLVKAESLLVQLV